MFIEPSSDPDNEWFTDIGWVTNYCLWTVMSEQNLESCLKLRNSQNPFCHILETLNNKNYEKKIGMICSFNSNL